MKPIIIVSFNKTLKVLIFGLFIWLLLLISYIKSGSSIDETAPYLILMATAILIPIIPFVIATIGRRLEVNKIGLNIGKRYQGPYSSSSQISPYSFFLKLSKRHLVISWGDIQEISFGTWERFWARHWDIVTAHLTGDLSDATMSQKIATLFGIPVIKWRGNHLIIRTKNDEFYSLELNRHMAIATREAIGKFRHEKLVSIDNATL